MRRQGLLPGAAALGLALGLIVAIPAAAPRAWGQAHLATIGVDEIKPGMKGYGLTVFRGTVPERFDVEVLGTLRNFKPGQELVLIKTPHPRLEVTKAVAGMSGSPIFLEGRLAGAYSYSMAAFNVETLAGFTPIAPMLTEMRRPVPAGFWPLSGNGPLPAAQGEGGAPPSRADAETTRWDGAPGAYDLHAHARQIASRMASPTAALAPVATPLLVGGLGDRSAAFARSLFEPMGFDLVQGGGAGHAAPSADTPRHFVDGGGIAIELARGDVNLTGVGTVTHVEGPMLCAFGHPMMGAGNAAMPSAIADIQWIIASAQRSSKLGEAVRSLGAMVQDRPTAIVIDETKTAPTFPVTFSIDGADGAPKRTWKSDVADERFMSAGLVAAVLGGAVEATVGERRDITWRVRSKVRVRGHGTVEIEDFGLASGGTPEQDEWSRSRLVRLVGDVLNNPWERARVEGVEASMSVTYAREVWRLRGVELLETQVDAGEKARLRLHLLPHAGPEVVRVVEAPVPAVLAGHDVDVEVSPGYEVAPEAPSPEGLSDLLANATRQSATPRAVVVSMRLPMPGVVYRGHVAGDLPAFALDALRPLSTDIGPEPVNTVARTVVPLERYVEGRSKVKLKVRERLR